MDRILGLACVFFVDIAAKIEPVLVARQQHQIAQFERCLSGEERIAFPGERAYLAVDPDPLGVDVHAKHGVFLVGRCNCKRDYAAAAADFEYAPRQGRCVCGKQEGVLCRLVNSGQYLEMKCAE